jgi:hypothetical protein
MNKAMLSGQNKVWMHYLNNIIAADLASAVFLSSYTRVALRGRSNEIYHEVVDLQRYKVFRTPKKVRAAMSNRVNLPFVFLVGKN